VSQYNGSQQQISWGDPWYTAYLVGTRQPGGKEDSSKIGHAWTLNMKSCFSVRNVVLLYRQLIRPMMVCTCPG
jgi:hypothetical protein